MIRRRELSGSEWDFVRPLLPRTSAGRPRRDDRMVLNGIVWKFRAGAAWRDVPERYGRPTTLHTRFHRWARDGTFARMLRRAQAKADAAGQIGRLVSIASAVVRVHQHAAGPKRGLPAPGRSRCGLTSEIHMACGAVGRPLAFVITGGNTNDCAQFTAVMEAMLWSPHRPRTATAASRPPDSRRGLQLEDHPRVAEAPRHRTHHPRASGPDPQPSPARQQRGPPAGLRQAALQATQRSGTLLQRPQAMARNRYQV